jgi:hypothetical protein
MIIYDSDEIYAEEVCGACQAPLTNEPMLVTLHYQNPPATMTRHYQKGNLYFHRSCYEAISDSLPETGDFT